MVVPEGEGVRRGLCQITLATCCFSTKERVTCTLPPPDIVYICLRVWRCRVSNWCIVLSRTCSQSQSRVIDCSRRSNINFSSRPPAGARHTQRQHAPVNASDFGRRPQAAAFRAAALRRPAATGRRCSRDRGTASRGDLVTRTAVDFLTACQWIWTYCVAVSVTKFREVSDSRSVA